MLVMLTKRQLKRFMAKVSVTDSCWLWIAAINSSGYGVFWVGGNQSEMAHRVAFKHWKRDIPEKMEIDHLCSVRSCVNPEHLRICSHLENMATAAFSVKNTLQAGTFSRTILCR